MTYMESKKQKLQLIDTEKRLWLPTGRKVGGQCKVEKGDWSYTYLVIK